MIKGYWRPVCKFSKSPSLRSLCWYVSRSFLTVRMNPLNIDSLTAQNDYHYPMFQAIHVFFLRPGKDSFWLGNHMVFFRKLLLTYWHRLEVDHFLRKKLQTFYMICSIWAKTLPAMHEVQHSLPHGVPSISERKTSLAYHSDSEISQESYHILLVSNQTRWFEMMKDQKV